MPLTPVQKQNAMAPAFANARKAMQDYIKKFGLDRLYELHQANPANLARLVRAFHPDKLYSLVQGLTPAELQQLAGFSQATLDSLGDVSPDWVRAMYGIATQVAPTHASLLQLPNGAAGTPPASPGLGNRVDQTSTQTALANHVVTERRNGPRAGPPSWPGRLQALAHLFPVLPESSHRRLHHQRLARVPHRLVARRRDLGCRRPAADAHDPERGRGAIRRLTPSSSS
jgi:hypothetical protein